MDNHYALMKELLDRSVYHNMEYITHEVDECITTFEMNYNEILKVQVCKSQETLEWLAKTISKNEIILIPNDELSYWLFESHNELIAKYALLRVTTTNQLVFIADCLNNKMIERWIDDIPSTECNICMEDSREFMICHVCYNKMCLICSDKVLCCPFCRSI